MQIGVTEILGIITIVVGLIGCIYTAGKYFGNSEKGTDLLRQRVDKLEEWKENILTELRNEFANKEITKLAYENLKEKVDEISDMVSDIHRIMLGNKRHSDNK